MCRPVYSVIYIYIYIYTHTYIVFKFVSCFVASFKLCCV